MFLKYFYFTKKIKRKTKQKNINHDHRHYRIIQKFCSLHGQKIGEPNKDNFEAALHGIFLAHPLRNPSFKWEQDKGPFMSPPINGPDLLHFQSKCGNQMMGTDGRLACKGAVRVDASHGRGARGGPRGRPHNRGSKDAIECVRIGYNFCLSKSEPAK